MNLFGVWVGLVLAVIVFKIMNRWSNSKPGDRSENAVGAIHPETLPSKFKTPVRDMWTGKDLLRAISEAGRQLTNLEKKFGPDHETVAEGLWKLGALYCTSQNYLQEEAVLRRCLAVYEGKCGHNHVKTGHCLYRLGICLARQAKNIEAENLFFRAMAVFEKAKVDKVIGAVEQRLAELYREQNELGKSAYYQTRALDHLRTAFGDRHPNVARAICGQGDQAMAEKNYIEAEKYFLNALVVFESHENSFPLDTIGIMAQLTKIALVNNNLELAEKRQKQGLQLMEIHCPETNREYLAARLRLSVIYKLQNRLPLSLETALAINRTLEKHPSLEGSVPAIRLYEQLSFLLSETGRWAEAAEFAARLIAGLEAQMGADHEILVEPLRRQALIMHQLGNLEEAERLERRAGLIQERAGKKN